MHFIKKHCVCDEDVMQPDYTITYDYLAQESMDKYHNIVDSNRWEPTDSKKKSQYGTFLLKASTVEIEDPVNKTLEKVYFKIHHNGKDHNYVVGSYKKSVATFHKCVKSEI